MRSNLFVAHNLSCVKIYTHVKSFIQSDNLTQNMESNYKIGQKKKITSLIFKCLYALANIINSFENLNLNHNIHSFISPNFLSIIIIIQSKTNEICI